MKITEILMAEHAVFHNLFDHVEATVPQLRTVAEVKSLGQLITKLTEAHSQTEDELFIAPLEHCFDQLGQKETFHEEHELIDQALAQVQTARDLKTAGPAAGGGERLAHPFRQGGTDRVPLAERILKTRTLTELGAEWLKKRNQKLRQKQ